MAAIVKRNANGRNTTAWEIRAKTKSFTRQAEGILVQAGEAVPDDEHSKRVEQYEAEVKIDGHTHTAYFFSQGT